MPVALGARAVAVLTTLAERSNEYVQKDAIMDAAWPGVVVEESNLAVQISAIRRVLAQAPGVEEDEKAGRGLCAMYASEVYKPNKSNEYQTSFRSAVLKA